MRRSSRSCLLWLAHQRMELTDPRKKLVEGHYCHPGQVLTKPFEARFLCRRIERTRVAYNHEAPRLRAEELGLLGQGQLGKARGQSIAIFQHLGEGSREIYRQGKSLVSV